MARITRTLLAVSAVAAVAALTACASSSQAGGNGPQQLAAQVKIETNPTPTPTGSPAPATPKVPDVPLTTELNGKRIPQMGKVVTNQDGFVLYRFDKDSPNPSKSNCEGDCARVFVPALTDGTTKLSGVEKEKVGTVTRADGSEQLTIGGWPVYSYIGDTKPGQWKGQKVAGTWFVVAPDGKKNLSCLPEGTPKPVSPPPLPDGAQENPAPPAKSPEPPAQSPQAPADGDGTGAAGGGFQF